MTILTVIKQDNTSETFDNAIGHQIGNGAVQVMINDGTQRVFNNFIEVTVDLDEEEKADFKNRIEAAEAMANARMEADKPNNDGAESESNVVALDS